MELSIFPGDKVLVNKLAYGPQLPRSPFEIPLVNVLYYLTSDSKDDLGKKVWDPQRLEGVSKIKVGDVAVFIKDEADGTPYIKRCVGIPGDSLIIADGGRSGSEGKDWYKYAQVPIRIWTRESREMGKRLDSLHINILMAHYRSLLDRPAFQCLVPQFLISEIDSWSITDSLELEPPINELHSWYLASIDTTWTIYNFGPLVIPGKGMQIVLNDSTYACYGHVIRESEGVDLTFDDENYFIEGQRVFSYTFREDYYFFMGDNRGDSYDSRYGEFIPKQNIIGRSDLILFSNRYGVFDWDRFFKWL